MALLNLTQAASMAGISRVTLNKHLHHGRLEGKNRNKISTVNADDGSIRIDSAEIIRVYGSGSLNVNGTTARSVNGNRVFTNPLEIKIELLQAELIAAHDLLAERAELVQALKDKVTLLEHKTTSQDLIDIVPPPKRGWFSRMFS